MDYKNHLIIGSIVSLIVSIILYFTTSLIQLNMQTIVMVLMIAYIFSLLPDIDIKSGTIVWNFLGVGILGILFSILNNYIHLVNNGTSIMIASCVLLVITFVCAEFCNHRGIIHSLAFGAIASVSIYFIIPNISLCIIAFFAFWSHLCADNLWFKLI